MFNTNTFLGGTLDDLQKFVQTPPRQQDCEFEYWNSEPIPDFYDRLPDQTIDPRNGKEFTISQSLIKKVRELAKGELCPKQFYHVSLHREYDKTSEAMAMGSRFEYELTGAHDLDGTIPDMVLTSTGKIGADQNRISDNAMMGKETLRRLGVYLNRAEVQAKVKFKCLSSNMDILFIDESQGDYDWFIDDVKYSGVIDSDFSDYAWKPENIASSFDMKCQALHYISLAIFSGCTSVRFRYLVFDNRPNHEGEYQVFEVVASEKALNQHKHVILTTIDQLQKRFNGEGFDAVPAYEKCKDCPVKCESRVKYPEIKVVEI